VYAYLSDEEFVHAVIKDDEGKPVVPSTRVVGIRG